MKRKKTKKEPGHDRSESQKNVGHTGSYKSGEELRKTEQQDQQKVTETNRQINRQRGNNTDNWDLGT